MSKLTVRKLIAAYRSDPDSSYCKPENKGGLRYHTKENYDSLMKRLDADCGNIAVVDINARGMLRLHERWTESGVSIAHSLVVMIRTLATYGATLLENADCRALKALLHDMRFTMGKPRVVHLTAEQADLVRQEAQEQGLPSMALAQAMQFECAFRQKDVIGEWVPESEPGESYVFWRGLKWLRGIRWEEIDDKLILRHVTSKRLKLVEPDLKLAPMVIEELERAYPGLVLSHAVVDEETGAIIKEMEVDRSVLPVRGPIIVFEENGQPYHNYTYRRTWRGLATAAGVPKDVQNRDSRAGAITEATDSGADLHDAQQMAAHSDIATTQIYSRGKAQKAARAMQARVVGRKRAAAEKPKLLPYFPAAGTA